MFILNHEQLWDESGWKGSELVVQRLVEACNEVGGGREEESCRLVQLVSWIRKKAENTTHCSQARREWWTLMHIKRPSPRSQKNVIAERFRKDV